MAAFFGNASHTLDPKGRATIPAAYREALGSSFTIGLNYSDTAMVLYPKEKWDKISQDLARIPESDAKGMRYVLKIAGFSFVGCDLDAQGRVLLPASLRARAHISKNICFVGAVNHLEIWDEERYNNEIDSYQSDKDELMQYVNDRYFSDHQ